MTALFELECSGKVDRLDTEGVEEYLSQIDSGWKITEDLLSLYREFVVGNYDETLHLVGIVSSIAKIQDHHPEISFGYRNCTVTWSTHSVGGLSINDFICAARIDKATSE